MSSLCHVSFSKIIKSRISKIPLALPPCWLIGTNLLMQLTTSTSTSSSDGFFIHSNESIENGYMISSRIDKDLMSNGNDSSFMGTDINIDDDPRQTTIDYNSIDNDNSNINNTITSIISSPINNDNSNSSALSRADMQSYSSYNETAEIDIEVGLVGQTVNNSSFGDDNVDDDRVVLDNSSASFNTPTHEQDSQHSSNSDNLFDSSHRTIHSNTDDSINSGMHFNAIVPPTPIGQLLQRYKGKVVCINSPYFPHCDIYLCGTLHVAHNSISMVQEAIQVISPHYVVLELCESRIDNLEEVDSNANLTISEVLQSTFEQKTLKSLGMGLLAWMQLKAAKMMGSRLGGELTTAAKEAYLVRSTIVLGDRLYAVTIQRIFDKLKLFEKVKIIVLMVWELLSMSLFKLKDYISKTENDTDFVKDEIAR